MTIPEASELILALTRRISAARGEGRSWQLVALAAIHYCHGLQAELDRLRTSHHRLLDEVRASRRKAA